MPHGCFASCVPPKCCRFPCATRGRLTLGYKTTPKTTVCGAQEYAEQSNSPIDMLAGTQRFHCFLCSVSSSATAMYEVKWSPSSAERRGSPQQTSEQGFFPWHPADFKPKMLQCRTPEPLLHLLSRTAHHPGLRPGLLRHHSSRYHPV